MRYILTTLFIALLSTLNAQFDVVKWSIDFDKETSIVSIDADIEDSWVMYSQHTDPEGPIPLEFEFVESEDFSLIEEVIEITKPTIKFSEMFDIEVSKFTDQAKFEQKVKLNKSSGTIVVNVTFMTCDSEKCLPPRTVPLELNF